MIFQLGTMPKNIKTSKTAISEKQKLTTAKKIFSVGKMIFST